MNNDPSREVSEQIKDFLSNLSEKSSQYAHSVDPSKVDLENGIKLISKIQKLKIDDVTLTGSQHFYSATFCLHECFDIKFRYFGGFADKNNEGQFGFFIGYEVKSFFFNLK